MRLGRTVLWTGSSLLLLLRTVPVCCFDSLDTGLESVCVGECLGMCTYVVCVWACVGVGVCACVYVLWGVVYYCVAKSCLSS